MSIYYIDYENVHEKGMKGLEKLAKTDTVCLLYSETAQSLTIDTMAGLTSSGVNVLYFKCMNTGKNYLDFQLSTVCGLMAGRGADTDFVIVSEDKGFASLVDFWNGQTYFGRKYTCRQQSAIESTEKKAEKKAEKKENGKGAKKSKNSKGGKTGISTETGSKKPEAQKAEPKKQEPQKQEPKKPEPKKQESKKQKKGGLLQQRGISSIAESTRKRVRAAVKDLDLKPTEYTLIYNIMLKATAESDFKNRLMQGLGKERGEKVNKVIAEIYQNLLK